MAAQNPVFRGAFSGPDEEATGSGKRPVIFDILLPDRETSVLPDGYRLVLHTNPQSLSFKYTRKVERIQTKGGYVEQHWGDDTQSLSLNGATGGFMRLYSGLSNVTSPEMTDGTRRETLAYDRYLDFLALFHNNGSIYDAFGNIVAQGIIKVIFDGGVYLGWFTNFSVSESMDKPFQFALSADMDIAEELQVWRTSYSGAGANITSLGDARMDPGSVPDIFGGGGL